MKLLITRRGQVQCLYSEALDLARLGKLKIKRASDVEPTPEGQWQAVIRDGPTLGPFRKRSEALAAEIQWLEKHRLVSGPVPITSNARGDAGS